MNSKILKDSSTWRVDTVVEQKNVTWTHFTWTVINYMNLKHKKQYYNCMNNVDEKIVFNLEKTQKFLKISVSCDVLNKTMYFCVVNQTATCLFAEASRDDKGFYSVEFCNATISERKNGFLHKGMLRISCRYISKPNVHKNIVLPFGHVKDTTHSNQVCRDLRNMYIKSIACDFMVQVGDANFKVHKSVMAARSPYLASLMSDVTTDTLVLSVDPAIMNDVFLFMYSAELPDLTLTKVFSMMYLANLLNIPSLKKKLLNHLKENFNEENMYLILELAIDRNFRELVRQALDHINKQMPHLLLIEEYNKLIQKSDAILSSPCRKKFPTFTKFTIKTI